MQMIAYILKKVSLDFKRYTVIQIIHAQNRMFEIASIKSWYDVEIKKVNGIVKIPTYRIKFEAILFIIFLEKL
jgi:hypothetical protein